MATESELRAEISFKKRSYELGRQVIWYYVALGDNILEHIPSNASGFNLSYRQGMKAEAAKHGIVIVEDYDYACYQPS